MRNPLVWTSLVAIFIALLLFGANSNIIESLGLARSAATTEAGLGCSTGVGETACSVTLAAASAFDGMGFVTVTETSPGSADRTGDSALAGNGVTLTVGDLVPSTAYTFGVSYRTVRDGVPAPLNAAMQAPLQVLLGFAGVLVAIAIFYGPLFKRSG
jgi:hypothetical protein